MIYLSVYDEQQIFVKIFLHNFSKDEPQKLQEDIDNVFTMAP